MDKGQFGASQMVEIETLRLRLRPIQESDFDTLFEMWSDADVVRYLPTGEPRTRQATRAELDYILNHWETHGYGLWSITIKNRDEMIGYCGLQHLHAEPGGIAPEDLDQASGEVEIAFGLQKQYWGKGIAYEAARAAMRYGFESLSLPRIVAAVACDNHASRRVLEKLEMEPDDDLHFYGNCPHYLRYLESFSPDISLYTVRESHGRP
jgi:ribosomal-protein-alanine N-acetyltransferase